MMKYGIPFAATHLENLRRLTALLTTAAGQEALGKDYEVTERGEVMVEFKVISKSICDIFGMVTI
jgi:hypothetical protein